MRRTPDIQDEIKDLRNRLELLEKRAAAMAKAEPVAFTPGPWTVGKKYHDQCVVRVHSTNWFGMIHVHWQNGVDESIAVAEANARLIAEAPAMFDVFCGCLENDKPPDFSEMVAIIKRVRGQ